MSRIRTALIRKEAVNGEQRDSGGPDTMFVVDLLEMDKLLRQEGSQVKQILCNRCC